MSSGPSRLYSTCWISRFQFVSCVRVELAQVAAPLVVLLDGAVAAVPLVDIAVVVFPAPTQAPTAPHRRFRVPPLRRRYPGQGLRRRDVAADPRRLRRRRGCRW